jgi:hypothetical protein
MPSYISSNANRFYTALESTFGVVASITAADRIPAVKLGIRQQLDGGQRRDKTGSRTFGGTPAGVRRRTDFDLQTYLTSWDKSAAAPAYGPLFQSALGAAPQRFAGGMVASASAQGNIQFAAAHGLSAGQGVSSGGEVRFVAAIVDANTVQVNAPFTTLPAAGSMLSATVTYQPATELPSVSLFDYWSPSTAVQRILQGATVDQMEIAINGDFHQFRFTGLAKDLLDSATFDGPVGQLQAYPPEPAIAAFDYSIVPGHLGQAWLGVSPTKFCTITGGSVVVKNELAARSREFGNCAPKAFAPGGRTVTAAFDLYSMDSAATTELYEAARQGSPITVMFQLGQVDGQVVGVYLKSVVPEVPEFDDSDNRLQWKFRASRAQGTIDDEISVAFA